MAVKSLVSRATIVVALAGASLGAQAQTFVDVESHGAPVTASFAAGTYSISFVDRTALSGGFDAYSVRVQSYVPFVPQESYRTLVTFVDGTNTFDFGYALSPSTGRYIEYVTTAEAIAAANASPTTFTLDGPKTVSFYIPDNQYRDNNGGVSLSISAVPEPGTYAMMLAGLAAIGFVARRRRDA